LEECGNPAWIVIFHDFDPVAFVKVLEVNCGTGQLVYVLWWVFPQSANVGTILRGDMLQYGVLWWRATILPQSKRGDVRAV
jgi:hypothetical protein